MTGRFVNITSVKGRMAGPLDSTYTITKWAGEAFSDILRREMRRFGVRVVVVEPGDFGGLTGMLSQQTVRIYPLFVQLSRPREKTNIVDSA